MAQHRQFLTRGQHAFLGLFHIGVVVHHLEFQVGGLADELNGPFRVLQAGQLNLDAVVGLLADVRFGHTEFVNTIADGLDGLIHGHTGQFVPIARNEGQRVAVATFRDAFHMCTGIRMVRAWSAMARVMAWRIHQVA